MPLDLWASLWVVRPHYSTIYIAYLQFIVVSGAIGSIIFLNNVNTVTVLVLHFNKNRTSKIFQKPSVKLCHFATLADIIFLC